MICKRCKGKTKVTNTVGGETVERYRKCLKCGANYNTLEVISYAPHTEQYAQRAFKANDKLTQYIPK
jgi:transcriptional regulator NrdR family protein